ncbi:MAG: DUF1573 domain-containing protein [Bacteroidota bacterium]
MKTVKFSIIILIAGVLMTACRDRAAEKRIAELEARLAAVEGGKTDPGVTPSAVTPTPAAPAAEQKPEGPLPALEFEKTDHDFGTIAEGQKVSYTYKFKNVGQAPLIIQNAQPSCGCTAPDWTRTPIPVGGTGFVKAEFDSKGKPGANSKTITVTANTWPKTTTLRFTASVTGLGGQAGPVK